MKEMIRRLALLAAGICAAGPANAQEAGTMRWMVQDRPPHFAYQNGRAPQRPEDLGHGEIDGFLRLLIQQMPQYRHEFVEAGVARFEALVRQQGQPLCSLLLLRTPERLGWLYFTNLYPPLVSRQIHVIVRRDRLAQFETQQGQVLQLAELLQQHPELVGLLPKDRSFGPRIDALLQAQGAKAPKTIVTGRSATLLAMLRAGRMDYTLEYPNTVDEFLHGSAAGPELVKLPVAEGRSTALATAACGRNAEGRKAIEAIDQAVRRLAQDSRREALLRDWRLEHLDEQERMRLNRYMDERARGGAQIE